MPHTLTVVSGPEKGRSWIVGAERMTIGRNRTCPIAIAHSSVSRYHCEVWVENDELRLADLESRNATFVNGVRIDQAAILPGDEIAVGKSLLVAGRVSDEPGPAHTNRRDQTPITRTLAEAIYLTDQDAATRVGPAIALRELRDLFSLARRFSNIESRTDLFSAIDEAANARFQPDRIWLVATLERNERRVLYLGNESEKPGAFPRELIDRVFQENSAVLHPERIARKMTTTLAAPLSMGNHVFGALAVRVASPKTVYDESDLEFFVAFAQMTAPFLRALQRTDQLKRDLAHVQPGDAPDHGLIGDSPAMCALREKLTSAAASDLNIILIGESGTGKELAARMLHDESARAGQPYVTLNCATLRGDLTASELFGHERGAFTGAEKRRIGRLEEAHGGTLLLDEVPDMPLPVQALLLRAIEGNTYHRVGGAEPLRADVRFISTAHAPLRSEDSEFREDLYYRLCGIEIHLPPLRERISDIPQLTTHFIKTSRLSGGRYTTISPEAMEALQSWSWPGNVRELQFTIQRALALTSEGLIKPAHLMLPTAGSFTHTPQTLAEAERAHIVRTLDTHHGNLTATAKALGIARSTLYLKLEQYGIKT